MASAVGVGVAMGRGKVPPAVAQLGPRAAEAVPVAEVGAEQVVRFGRDGGVPVGWGARGLLSLRWACVGVRWDVGGVSSASVEQAQGVPHARTYQRGSSSAHVGVATFTAGIV